MPIIKAFFIIALHLIASIALAEPADFAFVNKTFSRDLNISMRLYKSYEEFATPANQPFYMVVPQKEISLFEQEFSKARNAGTLKTRPHFIADENVFKQCGEHVYDKIMEMDGWRQQQMVKLCFYNMNLAKNYMTIDSDTYFTKDFPTTVLFKDGLIKTYAADKFKTNNREEFFKKEPELFNFVDKIKYIIGDNSADYNNFVSGFGLWSSNILHKLSEFARQKYGYDFADLINISPYEMQWYGNFIFTKHNNLFFPIGDVFTSIDSKIARHQDKCFPTKGCSWHYGISYHHSTEAVYVNHCSGTKTSFKMFFRRLNLYISSFRQKIHLY